MPILPPLDDRYPQVSDLRRFGLALARDDRFVLDRSAAEALVDRLFRQASLGLVDSEPRSQPNQRGRESERVRAFGQFIRLYRRHVRRLMCEASQAVGDESLERARSGALPGGVNVAAALRMLPLELREALLIVVLARFTHKDAALALDIPLAGLINRLTLARDRLAALTRADRETVDASAQVVLHLRIVK